MDKEYSVPVPEPGPTTIIQRVFEIADVHGFRGTRIAKILNGDPTIPAKYKPFYGSTVDDWLSNALYAGIYEIGHTNTDIVDDVKVVRKVEDKSEILRVEDFCEPIVSRERFERIQQVNAARAAARAARKTEKSVDGKLIQPLVPGISLVYPLAGLVCCGKCGASMSPRTSGRKSKGGTRYVYYQCPRSMCGACSNYRTVRESELWAATVSTLRKRLFSVDETDGVPSWLPRIVSLVDQFVAKELLNQPKASELNKARVEEERVKVLGWTQSLADPKLPQALRSHIEKNLTNSLVTIEALEASAASDEALEQHVKKVINQETVIERLKRLETVLSGSNINVLNIELTKHIATIDCHEDGRVVLTGTNLGVFDGAVELLTRDALVTHESSAVAGGGGGRVIPRRRSPRRIDSLTNADQVNATDAFQAVDPTRFQGLPPEFMWAESFVVGIRPSWAESHAQEVFRAHQEDPEASLNELAKRFGKTRPTITAAIEIAQGLRPVKNGRRQRTATGNTHREPDNRDPIELMRLVRADYDAGEMQKAIAVKHNLDRNCVHELLERSFAESGEAMPDGRGRRANLKCKQLNPPKYKSLADEVHALEKAGLSLKEIGERKGIDSTTLTKIRRYWYESHDLPFLDGRARRKSLNSPKEEREGG
jgi:hypothetical protein